MVWHEIDYHIQACIMSTCHESLELRHTVLDIHCQVRVNIIVILYGIWRTGLTLHHMGVVGCDPFGTIIGFGGMLYHPGVPHMGNTELLDLSKHGIGYVIHFSGTILLIGTVGDASWIGISEKSRK